MRWIILANEDPRGRELAPLTSSRRNPEHDPGYCYLMAGWRHVRTITRAESKYRRNDRWFYEA